MQKRRLKYSLVGARGTSGAVLPEKRKWVTPNGLKWMNLFACVAHGVNTFFMWYLPKKPVKGSVFFEYVVWEDKRQSGEMDAQPFEIYPRVDHSAGEILLKYPVGAFTALSCLFHLAYWLSYDTKFVRTFIVDYKARLDARSMYVRFIEYALSASLMLCLLAYFAGIRTVFHLALIGTLSIATQCCGIVIERNFSVKDEYDEKKHFKQNLWLWGAGAFFLLVVFGDIFTTLFISADNIADGEAKMPEFVYWIVGGEAGLYCCFGIVQLYRIFVEPKIEKRLKKEGEGDPPADEVKNEFKDLFLKCELVYIILSIVAKTFLAWIVFFSVLMSSKYCESQDMCN